jgi:TPR repeat protein
MYEQGEGTKPDRQEAFVWFFLAARRGQPEAAAEARRIRSSMTAKEWKDTQKKLPRGYDPQAIDKLLEESSSRANGPVLR